jgi:pimeloyl-ACP methyl ester carboxylesterase
MTGDDIGAVFNYCEAGLWLAFAVTLAIGSCQSGAASRTLQVTAVIAFALFGLSDLIEAQTGAWWWPWPLLVLKTGCVVVLFGCLVGYHRTKSRSTASPEAISGQPEHIAVDDGQTGGGLQLRSHGDASLPALIYLPGMHGDWTLVSSFRAAVAERLRFVEITYPRTTRWSLEDHAHAIERELLANGVSRGWLLGESFGSQPAWALISRAPGTADAAASGADEAEAAGATSRFQPEGLILAGGFVRHPLPWGVRLLQALNRAAPMWGLKVCCWFYGRYARFRHRDAPETLACVSEFVVRRTDEADRQAIVHRYSLIAENDLRPAARRTHLPVYYLAGLVDPLVPWCYVRWWLRRRCPGYRGGIILWRADHNVLATAPRACAERVLAWLRTEARPLPEKIPVAAAPAAPPVAQRR